MIIVLPRRCAHLLSLSLLRLDVILRGWSCQEEADVMGGEYSCLAAAEDVPGADWSEDIWCAGVGMVSTLGGLEKLSKP